MTKVEAKHEAERINQITNWPKGVTVVAVISGGWLSVQISAKGAVPIVMAFSKPLGLFAWRDLRDAVDEVAHEAARSDDDVESEPEWLTKTLNKIGARTSGRPFLREAAWSVARCLEFDDIPAPEVIDFQGVSIVLRWRHAGRTLEIGTAIDGTVCLAVLNVYGIEYVMSYPYHDIDFRNRGQVWAVLRGTVQSVLGRESVTRGVVEAELTT